MSQRDFSLPDWDAKLPSEAEFKKVYARCRKIYDEHQRKLANSLAEGTFVAVDAKTGMLTPGNKGDDELSVWEAHYGKLPHKDIRQSVIFRLGID